MTLTGIIEIPFGSNLKFEVDKKTGRLFLDRVLNVIIPYNYGYLQNTLSEDGDPSDFFMLGIDRIPPLTQVKLELLGCYECLDQGIEDNKFIVQLVGNDWIWNKEAADRLIREYLNNYKTGFEIKKYHNTDSAGQLLEVAQKNYDKIQR